MRFRVLPYRQGSASAKALASALGGKVLKLEGSSFSPRAGDRVINWGCIERPPLLQDATGHILPSVLNGPEAIRAASNKLRFFQLLYAADMAGIIPRFWTNREEIPDDAFPVVCRTVLAGHSGDGIVISPTRNDLVSAPLYVEYVKKQEEYRVHVGRRASEGGGGAEESIIAVQRKARRIEHETPNWQIRNHANGFIYQRQGVSPPEDVCAVAKRALSATLLDFGAVDVLWNASKRKAYVLEINTAPGLEGQTVEDYASFFRSLSASGT